MMVPHGRISTDFNYPLHRITYKVQILKKIIKGGKKDHG